MHPVFKLRLPSQGRVLLHHYSFSSLLQVERCPRQWWLLNGEYEELPGRYPELWYPRTIIGTIVHSALNTFSIGLKRLGNPAPKSEAFHNARRSFPLRRIIQELRQKELSKLEENPRLDISNIYKEISVDECVNIFKRLLSQVYQPIDASSDTENMGPESKTVDAEIFRTKSKNLEINSNELISMFGNDADNILPPVSLPGVFTEYRIAIKDPPLIGTIDLIVTDIDGDSVIEFKTGDYRAEHESQLRMYGVLWYLHTGRIAKDYLCIYSDGSLMKFPGLESIDLNKEIYYLRRRINLTGKELSKDIPQAYPDAERCSWCSVRQLCDPYWQDNLTVKKRWDEDSITRLKSTTPPRDFKDIELNLDNACLSPNGFSVNLTFHKNGNKASDQNKITCTVPPKFYPDSILDQSRVRILNAGILWNGNSYSLILNRATEMFWR
jgi:hypothetical protein